MRTVMTEGTGKGSDLSWIEVGGKTGTTEKYVVGSGYSRSKHYASFVGVAPLEDPKIVCFVMIDEPNQRASFGGSAAAPVFHEVLEDFGRLPGAWLRPEYETMVVETYEPRGLEKLMPAPLIAAASAKGAPRSPSPDVGLPDVRGESLRRALQILHAHGVTTAVQGSGVVLQQTPRPGSKINGKVTLVCSRRGKDTVVLASGAHAFMEERQNALGAESPGWR